MMPMSPKEYQELLDHRKVHIVQAITTLIDERLKAHALAGKRLCAHEHGALVLEFDTRQFPFILGLEEADTRVRVYGLYPGFSFEFRSPGVEETDVLGAMHCETAYGCVELHVSLRQ